MVIGFEGVGEVVTGGMAARAVEPHSGPRGEHEAACLNCGTALVGHYCHSCGQQGHVHRTLGAFGHDLLHGVLHFEGKTWRTLPMLAWRPGELTRRYIEGERARFVSPMALFLFSVFLMFAVFGWTGGPIAFGESQTGNNFQQGISESISQNQETVRELEKERAEAVAERRDPAKVEKKLKDAREELSMLQMMKDGGIADATITRASGDLPDSSDWFNKAYKKAKENPSLLLYKLQNSAYKFSWALIPISVPFVWLLFLWRPKYRLYDHTVFVTYSLTFMTMLVIAASIARVAGLGQGLVVLALTFVPPIHMYRQLRGAYRLSWFSALWRTFFLLVFASIAASLFFLLLLALGVLG
jgi:hypothetical protein